MIIQIYLNIIAIKLNIHRKQTDNNDYELSHFMLILNDCLFDLMIVTPLGIAEKGMITVPSDVITVLII